uniref:C-type lectin domain-containing protein n=1 Tax=Caenorhabditis japonica TaxID=281687 RepID=A0A8R1IN70_CAEJA
MFQFYYVNETGIDVDYAQNSCKTMGGTLPAITDDVDAFTFPDPSFPGTFKYYNWTTSPSAKVVADDNCLVYSVVGSAPITVDVRSCTMQSTYKSMGYLCKKNAWT